MAAIIIRGEDIRKARKARGMTQAALADLLGQERSVISRWEQDKIGIGNEPAKRLAAWLAQPAETVCDSPAQSAPTTSIPLSIPPKLADIAAELGIDIAELYSRIGTEAVRQELRRLWKEANAEAIEQQNQYVEKYGLPLAHLRTW